MIRKMYLQPTVWQWNISFFSYSPGCQCQLYRTASSSLLCLPGRLLSHYQAFSGAQTVLIIIAALLYWCASQCGNYLPPSAADAIYIGWLTDLLDRGRRRRRRFFASRLGVHNVVLMAHCNFPVGKTRPSLLSVTVFVVVKKPLKELCSE